MSEDVPTDVPDDVSSLVGDAAVALLVTPVASAAALAATCALAGVAVDVVPSPVGALAVCRDRSGDAPTGAARSVSQLLKGVPVVLLVRREAQLEASRWLDGARGDDLAPGLVLSDAPEILEDLAIGTVTPDEVEGVESSVGMSRLRAMRLLASSARKNRKA
ncbi:hypothetical protein [Cellulomonas fimi]|uniref:Uncharacterized protein n=1 Tax=Cellulomonas fimi TaxID=1708 RepID=A0A7Y0LYL9_CELFI|nr:hypothetical protein [Cellulomonas fimi]NMR20588.1 hypothetical protein [Cellulomonas fimi]